MNVQQGKQTGERAADRDPIHLAAADWLARLREPEVSLEETLAWQDWMAVDARHREAFARIEELSSMLRSIPRPARPLPTDRHNDEDAYDASVPLSEWRAHAHRGPALAIAASVAAAAIALGWAISTNTKTQILQTPVGENHRTVLEDGSTVTLGGNTKLEVSLNGKSRRIDLLHGEALFKVAKDKLRPFKVHAGDATVVAVGTEFNVRRSEDRVTVAVVEGRVIVEPTAGILPAALLREIKPKFAAVSLRAGQQTMAGGSGVEAAAPLADPAAATGWQSRRFAFRLEPLRYVLEDVNRYASKPIVVQDARVGNIKVTGTVAGDNIAGWVSSLESAFDLQATEEADRIVLRNALIRK